jgi:hypothetical protein
MDARVTLLERGFEEMRASLARIEAAQIEAVKEVRDLRRDLKETDLPKIGASLAKLEGQMEKTPTLHQLVAIFTIMLAAAVAVTGFNLLGR